MQEVIDFAFSLDKTFVPIEAMPMQAPTGAPPRMTYIHFQERFIDYIQGVYSIIIGQLNGSEMFHAVAWDGSSVYDPNDTLRNLSDFSIKEAWLLIEF